MKFKYGSFLGFVDRHGFVRIGGMGMHLESIGEGPKASIKQAAESNPNHPDAPGILQALAIDARAKARK